MSRKVAGKAEFLARPTEVFLPGRVRDAPGARAHEAASREDRGPRPQPPTGQSRGGCLQAPAKSRGAGEPRSAPEDFPMSVGSACAAGEPAHALPSICYGLGISEFTPEAPALLVCVLVDGIEASSRVLCNPADKKSSWGFERNSLCCQSSPEPPRVTAKPAPPACRTPRPGGALCRGQASAGRPCVRSRIHSFIHSFTHSLSRWLLASCPGPVTCSVLRRKAPPTPRHRSRGRGWLSA